jgi:uncharacterized membrane protein
MKKIVLIAGAALWFWACKHEPTALPPVPAPPPGGVGTQVCFETDVLPLFQTNCAKSGCHDAASRQKEYVLDNYNNIISKGLVPGNATNSKIYKVLFETGNDKMPPLPNPDLTAAQKALIGKWINEGARNTTGCGVVCDSNQFRFAAEVRPILQTHCVGCHSGGTPSGSIDLSTHANVQQQALNGKLYGAITHTPGFSPMPQNAGKLRDCQIAQVRKWIAAGAPNN